MLVDQTFSAQVAHLESINSKNKSVFLGVIMASGSFGQFVMVPFISYFINNFGWVYSSILA